MTYSVYQTPKLMSNEKRKEMMSEPNFKELMEMDWTQLEDVMRVADALAKETNPEYAYRKVLEQTLKSVDKLISQLAMARVKLDIAESRIKTLENKGD